MIYTRALLSLVFLTVFAGCSDVRNEYSDEKVTVGEVTERWHRPHKTEMVWGP